MFLRDKDKPMYSKMLIFSSMVAATLSAFDMFGFSVFLAGTQWLLVACLLASWGIYWLLEAEFRS